MELELGLKITQTRDDLTSTADLWFSKDAGSVLFFSWETEAMFILTGHLRGYKRKHIGIEINEDGTRISISGKRPLQQKVIQGWVMYKSEVELKGFLNVFQIPRGVVLDKIKAKFNEDGSVLTISMPKSVKGFSGEGIEEVKEAVDGDGDVERGPVRGETSTREVEDHPELDQETYEERTERHADGMVDRPDQVERESAERQESNVVPDEPLQQEERDAPRTGTVDETASVPERQDRVLETELKRQEDVPRDIKRDKRNDQQESAEPLGAAFATDQIAQGEDRDQEDTRNIGEGNGTRDEGRRKKLKICAPAAVAGSALLVSLVVLVINLTKAKQR